MQKQDLQKELAKCRHFDSRKIFRIQELTGRSSTMMSLFQIRKILLRSFRPAVLPRIASQELASIVHCLGKEESDVDPTLISFH